MFSEKLGNFEAKVNPELWANVASQVGAASGATAGASGMSLLTKAIIGISGAAVVTTGVVLYTSSEDEIPEPKKENTVVSNETTTSEKEPLEKEEKSVVVDLSNEETSNNEATILPVAPVEDPNRNVDPTTGPNDGRAGLQANELTNEPIAVEPVTTVTSTSTTLSEEQQQIINDRENDTKVLIQEHEQNIAKEDEPLNTIPATAIEEEKEEVSIIIPDVFTPDGNGFNDDYHLISGQDLEYKSFDFVIYDKTGNVVMMSKDPRFIWTGYDPVKGRLVETGQYAYVLVAETVKGTPIKETGTISVRY